MKRASPARSASALFVGLALLGCEDIAAPIAAPTATAVRVSGGASSVVTPGGITYTLVDLVGLGGYQGGAQLVNASGQAAGWSFVTGNFWYEAFRWTGGTITGLGALGGSHSYPFSMNAAGDMTGWAELPGNGSYHAALWRGTTVTDLGTLPGHTHSHGTAINDAGQVVGESSGSSGPPTGAFLWQDGVMTALPSPRRGSSATAINAHGDVVGQSGLGLRGGPPHAVLWRNGVATDLGTLNGFASHATGINDAGQVIGVVESTFGSHAFRWEDGVMTDLGALDGGRSSAEDINAHGDVVGNSFIASGHIRAVLWRGGEIVNLGTLPGGSYSQAMAINDAGLIAGISDDGEGRFHAVIWENGIIVDLGTLGGRSTGICCQYALSEAGHVVGQSETETGDVRPVMWVPADPTVVVTIDVKPGSATNPVNLRARGLIPVAILGTADFDATTVDAATVRFGPGAATEAHAKGHVEDVDGDGRVDLMLHFDMQASAFACGATTATLTGKAGNRPITGSDVVVTTGCR